MKILYTETSASSVEPGGFGRFVDGNGLVGSGHRSPSTSSGRAAMTLLLGEGEPDFTRQENWIRGNTRTLRRQYAARNWVFVRVLPGIAGYCRVVGPGEKLRVGSQRMEVTLSLTPTLSPRRGSRLLLRMERGLDCGRVPAFVTDPRFWSDRFGPAGTGWDRLGPLNFFPPRKTRQDRSGQRRAAFRGLDGRDRGS